MSLHKRFIRVAIFQRSYHSNRTSSKPMKFVWTSLKYKPKGFLKTNMNQSINDFNQMKQQEFLFYQNAAIFNNNQNFINLQNYNLNHYQLMDPNQIMQFYRFINTSAYYSNLANQVPINTENSEIVHADDQNKRIKLDENNYHRSFNNDNNNNDNKCSCSTCNIQTSQFQNSAPLWQAPLQEQQEIRYQIPFTLNSTSQLTIASKLVPSIAQSTKHVGVDEDINDDNKRLLNEEEQSPINLDDSSNEEIIVDSDDTSSDDSKSRYNNDQSSYNFKRKLMDRYISEDEDRVTFKKNEIDGSNNLESFLKTNKINSNLLKFSKTINQSKIDNSSLSQQKANSSNSSTSSSINHRNFGLLKKILNKK